MTSPSTLIRKARAAEKKGHKFAAKRLREQAAAMRRKARKAVAAKLRDGNKELSQEIERYKRLREQAAAAKKVAKRKPKRANSPISEAIRRSMDSQASASMPPPFGDAMQAGLSEIHPEAVASKPTIADVASKLLAEKDAPGFDIKLRAALVDARIEGESDGNKGWSQEIERYETLNAVSVVAGWMAIIELAQGANHGSLPPTMSMAGFTAAKVYDALKAAGYSSAGHKDQTVKHWRRTL